MFSICYYASPRSLVHCLHNLQLQEKSNLLIFLLEFFGVFELFYENGSAYHILDPRRRSFSVPYLVVLGFGAEIFTVFAFASNSS